MNIQEGKGHIDQVINKPQHIDIRIAFDNYPFISLHVGEKRTRIVELRVGFNALFLFSIWRGGGH